MLSLVLYPGELGDRHASMPRLRIQLYRDLPQGRAGGGGQHPPCGLWALSRDSLVDAGRVGTSTAAIGIAAGLQHYVLAIGATLLLMLVLKGMRRFEDSER
jgi:hypothetical protein